MKNNKLKNFTIILKLFLKLKIKDYDFLILREALFEDIISEQNIKNLIINNKRKLNKISIKLLKLIINNIFLKIKDQSIKSHSFVYVNLNLFAMKYLLKKINNEMMFNIINFNSKEYIKFLNSTINLKFIKENSLNMNKFLNDDYKFFLKQFKINQFTNKDIFYQLKNILKNINNFWEYHLFFEFLDYWVINYFKTIEIPDVIVELFFIIIKKSLTIESLKYLKIMNLLRIKYYILNYNLNILLNITDNFNFFKIQK